MKLQKFLALTLFPKLFAGNSMIFGKRKGKANEKCRRLENDEFECESEVEKALLAIPKTQSQGYQYFIRPLTRINGPLITVKAKAEK